MTLTLTPIMCSVYFSLLLPPPPRSPKKKIRVRRSDWRPQYLSYPSGQENEELRAEVVSSSLLPVKEFDSQ